LSGFSDKPKETVLKGHEREGNDFWVFSVLG